MGWALCSSVAQWLWHDVIDDTLRLARGMISEKIIAYSAA